MIKAAKEIWNVGDELVHRWGSYLLAGTRPWVLSSGRNKKPFDMSRCKIYYGLLRVLKNYICVCATVGVVVHPFHYVGSGN